MKRLIVDRLRCIEDTPEWSADEVYLLVVVAATRGSPELRTFSVAPEKSWQSLTSGNGNREVDVLVDADYRSDKLYIAALLEQEGARDFDIAEVKQALQQRLDETYRTFASYQGARVTEVSEEIQHELNRGITALRSNDDAIGHAFAVPVKPGTESGQVLLAAPGRKYCIWFKLA